jgi:hypothetical protein
MGVTAVPDKKWDNNLRGVLFKEELKDKDGAPDYKGSCEVGGIEYWISAWINTAKGTQRKFMSLKFRAKDMTSKSVQRRESAQSGIPFDDEIPF